MTNLENNLETIKKLKVDIILFLYSHPGTLFFHKTGRSTIILDKSLELDDNRMLIMDVMHQLKTNEYIVYKNEQLSGTTTKYISNADVYLTKSALASLWRLFLEDKGIDI